jgi:enolase
MALLIYLIGMIAIMFVLAVPLVNTISEGKNAINNAIIIFIIMSILWPLTMLGVLAVLWLGKRLPPTF